MPDTSLIGLTLAGRFRITGVIGEGGMATVYRGTVSDRPDEIAIKIMSPELAKETRFQRRFRREAKAAAMLKHPNTVQIIEFGDDGGYVFLAMELLRGIDLAMLLHRERRISEARAVQIVVQVCRALSAAHQQSIVHRDLKPDNIMLVRQPPGLATPIAGLGPNDFVKVLDFGIAKILDDDPDKPPGDPRAEPITQEKSMLTRVGTIVGTPAYMAPEQGRAEPVDARTDIYACGVLLYELITGRVPFTGETPMQVVMRHVNEPPRPPSDYAPINPELERVIMRALAKYPAERQQRADEMAFELLQLLPSLAPPPPPPPAEDDGVKRTLVLDRAPSTRAPLPAPRPAAGAPAPAPQQPSMSLGGAAQQSRAADLVQSPFPTLNIEVPDDIFPQDFGAALSAPGSTDPAPTQKVDVSRAAPVPTRPTGNQPGVRVQPLPPVARPAAGMPARPAPAADPKPHAPAPVQAQHGLDQTMQSSLTDSMPPPAPANEDEEEAPTVLKTGPDPTAKARMSLAEEAMAAALAGGPPTQGLPPPPPQNPLKASANIGIGLPKFSGPETVEPTLVANQQQTAAAIGPSPTLGTDATHISVAPPALDGPGVSIPKAPRAPGGSLPSVDLKNLQSTVPLEPEQVEKAIADAIGRRTASEGSADVPAGHISSPAPPRHVTPAPADRPARKPTSELIPVNLADATVAGAPLPEGAVLSGVPSAAVWQPKSRRLSGATALIVGIVIGAIVVALAIGLLVLLRGDAPN